MRTDSDAGQGKRLGSDLLLRRLPDLTIRVDGANLVRAAAPDGTWVDCGPRGLWLLERFQEPTTLRELAASGARSAQDWIDVTSAVQRLARAGVLVDVESTAEAVASVAYVFDNESAHASMLDDHPRTERFLAAIAATVRPGDVVVDIGTGTGVLAMAAARAGAAHVYAIEAGAIADHAERTVAANGLAGRITVIRGWSTRVELPRRADVLVTETIGSEPLDERILEVVTDARRRMLTPEARIIPSRLDVWGLAVRVPPDALAERIFTPERAKVWQERYGFDFAPLLPDVRRLRGHRFKSCNCRAWPRLAPAQRLVSLALTSLSSTTVDVEATVEATESGLLDGALVYFDAELAPGIAMSSNPDTARKDASWRNVLTLDPPVAIRAGDPLRFTYRYRSSRGPAGLQVAPAGRVGDIGQQAAEA